MSLYTCGFVVKKKIKIKINSSRFRCNFDFFFFFCKRQLAKVDVVTRKHYEWRQESCFPSEPVFVASPGAVEEDDGEEGGPLLIWMTTDSTFKTTHLLYRSSSSSPVGVILSSVISPNPNVSPFLLVLDARTFTEIARASIPASVHQDLHGLFIPAHQ